MASIVLAGGGTAGHIEPALAVAREWARASPGDRITFIGTATGLENILVPAAGFALSHIPKLSITRRPSLSWFKAIFQLINAVHSSRAIVKGADLLIGFGGYVSGPAYIAARISRVPMVIHEANAKPGWANRLGSIWSPYLCVAQGVQSGAFQSALITGLPLRQDVALAFEDSQGDFSTARVEAKRRLGFNNSAPLIFIMGGSQGSTWINRAIGQALPDILALGVSILHSVGRSNSLPAATENYHPIAYLDQMADAYLASDLIITRSGAVTCSEFRALGRYALFIPLPVGNGEQFYNARTLADEGRAQIVDQIDFDATYLLKHIEALLKRSAGAPTTGSDIDLHAAEKIVSLGRFAMSER